MMKKEMMILMEMEMMEMAITTTMTMIMLVQVSSQLFHVSLHSQQQCSCNFSCRAHQDSSPGSARKDKLVASDDAFNRQES
eukprot:757451-Hanusia_phi.AAC.3